MIVRKVIYSILNLFDHRKEKIPNLFLQKFKKHTRLSRKDKHRIRVCINEIIRYLGLIDHLIEVGSEKKIRHVNPKIRNVLRLGLYELVFDDMTPEFAAIHSNVELAKKNINKRSSSMVNAVMRNVQRLSQKNRNLKIFTKEIERTPLNLELPPVETLEQVNLIIITSDNQEEVFAKMKEQNIDPVIFGYSDEDWELVAKNNVRMRNHIVKLRAIIEAYQQYYEPEKKDSEESKNNFEPKKFNKDKD